MLFAITDNHPIVTDLQFVARQLTAHLGGAVDIAAMHETGNRQQQRRVIVWYVAGVEALRVLFGDESGGEVTGLEARVLHQRSLERDVRRDATDNETIQGIAHAFDGLFTGSTMNDQLGDHRVVVHRDFATFVNTGIDTHLARYFLRWGKLHQTTSRRQEATERVFGVDATFHRPAVELHVFLLE